MGSAILLQSDLMVPSCGFWRGKHAIPTRLGSVTVEIVRDWVVRFNDRGIDGLINGKARGKPSLLNDEQRAALAPALERGPTPYLDGVVRWRLSDLAQWIWEEFRVSISQETLAREVRAMGYRKLSARPRHHAQDAEAAGAFKKSPLQWQKSPLVLPKEG